MNSPNAAPLAYSVLCSVYTRPNTPWIIRGTSSKKSKANALPLRPFFLDWPAPNQKQPSIDQRTEPTEAARSLRLMRLQEPKSFIQRTRECRENIGSIVISQFVS